MRPPQDRWEAAGAVRWTQSRTGSAVVVLGSPVDPLDASEVCAGLRAGLRGATSVVCRGLALADPDITTVDLLARLVLFAKHSGASVHVRAPIELGELVRFAGLEERLGSCWSAVEPGGQPEQGEQPVGVQESVEADDHPV